MKVVALLLVSISVYAVFVTAKYQFADNHPYSAVLDEEGNWDVVGDERHSNAAVAYYNRSSNSTGWNLLTIVTNGSATDMQQAWGAGYLEGVLTQLDIWNSWLNYANGTVYPASPALITFITNQDKWVRLMVQENPSHAYFKQVGYTIHQFDGMMAGYAKVAPTEQQLSYTDALLYMLDYEVSDIEIALSLTYKPVEFDLHMSSERRAEAIANAPRDAFWFSSHASRHRHHHREPHHESQQHHKPGVKDSGSWPYPGLNSHCSVLIKPSSDGQRLYAAHDMWWPYSAMLRTYKHYTLNYQEKHTMAHSVSFSSYPGNLCSGDDFYITGQQLVVMETTNNVMNNSLYYNVTTETMPYWIRIGVANRMSLNGEDWVKHFSMYNSGTYNNQWMVVDMKLFEPGKPIAANTLWVAEQIPGYIVSADQTPTLLAQGYWPSYNVPFYPFIYNISDYPQYYDQFGDDYSYSQCARAQIFRRDEGSVQHIDDMQRIMRYNQYQTDPLSQQDAGKAISARGDLNVPWLQDAYVPYGAFGGIDSKITEASMVKSRHAIAVSGPTWTSQPPFAWTEQWNSVPHFGHPTVFDFDYIDVRPFEPSQ